MTHKKGDKFIGKCWLCGSVCNCEILKTGYERARAMEQKTCLNCGNKDASYCKPYCFNCAKWQPLPIPEKNEGLQIAERFDGKEFVSDKTDGTQPLPEKPEPVCRLPWEERVTAISIHPDMANRDDIARLAAELIDARGTISTAIGGIEALLLMSDRVPTAEDFEVVKHTLEYGLKSQEKK